MDIKPSLHITLASDYSSTALGHNGTRFSYIIGECLLPGKQPGYAYPYSHTWKVPKQDLHDKEPTLSMTCLMHAAHVLSAHAHVHINLAQVKIVEMYAHDMLAEISRSAVPEEVGHDHVRTKGGRVAPYI